MYRDLFLRSTRFFQHFPCFIPVQIKALKEHKYISFQFAAECAIKNSAPFYVHFEHMPFTLVQTGKQNEKYGPGSSP
jgi:hypothetical protein